MWDFEIATKRRDAARRGRPRLVRLLRPGLVVLVLGLALAVIAGMSVGVMGQMRALRTAASDNLQWTLAQVDTEFLRYHHAIEEARVNSMLGALTAADLAELRTRFDIFYSRIDTFRATGTYAKLRDDPEFSRAFADTGAALAQMMPLIDAPDDQLAAGLVALDTEAEAVAQTVRSLSLIGLAEFARQSDAGRVAITTMLMRLGGVASVLFVAISLLAVSLLRLYRLSETRAAERAATATRMRTVIETSLDGIIVCDRTGRIIEFSPAAETIFGRTAAEAKGRDMLGLILPPEAGMAPGSLALAAELRNPLPGAHDRIYLDGRRRDGSTFPAEASLRPADAGGGRIFVLFIRDISALKEAEAALTEARDRAVAGEKAKADFVAVMSHEMRTPLNGLLGSISLLRDTGLDARQRRYVDTVELSGRLLSGLVNDVLDLSKFEAGMMTLARAPFLLSRVLEDVVANQRELARAHGNRLGWSWCGPAFEPCIGDAAKLRQVLLNLVNNATKFTTDGEIRIEVEASPGTDALREVEFRVIDTGTGIGEADQERIFRDFEMLDSSYGRQGGTGLGLGIARRLVELMGGEIGVESTPGEGSLFWLRLPLERAEAAPPEARALRSRPRRRRAPVHPLSVLVVEDNEINRTLLREMIEAEGHAVTEAVNGREGVERAASTRFDLILMDVSMPVLDGRDATREIRAGAGASRDVPIIGVTAHALPEELAAFREVGMTEILKKPIDRPELVRLLAGTAQAGGATAPAPVFDPERCGAGPLSAATLRGLFERFVAQGDALAADLAAGAAGREEVLAAVHRCAGSAGALGALRLQMRLQALETAAKRDGAASLAAAAAAVLPVWTETRAAITDWLAAQRPGPPAG
ncbi:hybrid sensor histidine kinase/response regulator [Sinirhodobacter huangdaonensis]|uniref:histidine kinase n=1 Tax=Paenirhodobacter huangdaonensis TaxID=2501515 RepID=A0A443LZW1_9RHOB|nr:PAS domain-containing hybrid sensor histidine kinase/response regulator [Sinirhodobacter huangdaonensis]RWR54728.1 PAS domain-containing hybrid sensor histidine kinase/response regulator [Sinirhodobacter huangdaonensis]